MARYARKIRRKKMNDDTLKSIVQAEIHSATGSLLGSDGGGDLSDRRREAMEYYLSEPFGNEVEGRSQVVDSVVHDVIESALPNLLDIFLSSDRVVRFEPRQQEDEAVARQATDYVNHIIFNDNDGFNIFYQWFKDALLQKNGIVKVFWESTDAKKRETFTSLSELEVARILQDENVEAIEHDESEITRSREDGAGGSYEEIVAVHDLTVLRAYKKGRVRIVNVPPEEFLIARRATNISDAAFVAHRVKKSVSELIEEGYDPEILEKIPSYDEAEYNEERLARFEADDEWPIDANQMDPAMRSVWVYECYLRTDYDGDGIAELRQVTVAGPGYDLLDNVAIDFMPFASITPVPMPHKFFGMSYADETMDLQLTKSTVLRQLMDNMYNVNNHRLVANERVNFDDLLVNRPGAITRVEGIEPVNGSLEPIVTPSIGSFGYPLLEYLDGLREQRTGVTRYNQGLDADSLNKTATGIQQIMGMAQKRQQLVARIFAETGVRSLMKMILELVVKHQDEERIIRMQGNYVPMDPQTWNTDMDVDVDVAIGSGTKEQQALGVQQVIMDQYQMIQVQQGIQGPLVTPEDLYEARKSFVEALGFKDVGRFYTHPSEAPPQQPQPDPDMMKEQMKQQHLQATLQQEDRHHQDDVALKAKELELKYGLEQQKLGFEGQKIQNENQREDKKLMLEAQTKDVDNNFRAAEIYGKEGTPIFDDLRQAVAAMNNMGEALQTINQEFTKLADRVMEIEEDLSAPKEITVVRNSAGKPVGAKSKQGRRTSEVRLN